MQKIILLIVLFVWQMGDVQAAMLHKEAPFSDVWQEEGLAGFNELILSWNAKLPEQGGFKFYLSVKKEEWSPWFLYSAWGASGRESFKNESDGILVYQDALEVLGDEKARGFRVKIEAEGGADLREVFALHAYTNSDRKKESAFRDLLLDPIALDVPKRSQMALDHVRNAHLCSPTSTSAVVSYFLHTPVDPVTFAEKVWDGGFDIYGNWVFNVALASSYLQEPFRCWVERLGSFEEIYERLKKATPVVVSVRGPLKGSASAYASGHLLIVRGFDADGQRVLVMDPAFPTDEETYVSYDLKDFMEAWERRGRIAYIFERKHPG